MSLAIQNVSQADKLPLDISLVREWQGAVAGDEQGQASWQTEEGGLWSWEQHGVVVRNSGTEWSSLILSRCNGSTLRELKYFAIEVKLSGKAKAAGLSFGYFKDFLADLDSSTGCRHLKLQVDVAAGCWAFLVDGLLQNGCWLDSAIHSIDDLVNGTLERVHNQLWGYTQIVQRSTLERVPYPEQFNHFARSDEQFVEDCKGHGIHPEQVNGLLCLHLDHPSAWYDTEIFL